MYGNYNNGFNGFWNFPVLWNKFGGDDYSSKTAHDFYDIYVNKDYVGKKVLAAEGERIEDIKSFLKTQGFTEFSSELIGNEFSITCSEAAKKHVKEAVDVYIHNR